MRTDLKVGVICLFALVLACVGFFAYHSNKPGKEVVSVAGPSHTASPAGLSMSPPADAPSTAPSVVAAPAPSSLTGFGPSHALGADSTYTISPPGATTAPATIVPPGSSSPGLAAPGGMGAPGSLHEPLAPAPGNTSLSTGNTGLLPPSTPATAPGFTGSNTIGGFPSAGSAPTFGSSNAGSKMETPSHRATLEIGSTPSSSSSGMDFSSLSSSFSSSAGGTYTIQKGDTFGSLAKKNHTTSKAILAANPGVNPNRLKVGQKINMPSASSSASGSTGSSLGSLSGSTSVETFGSTATTPTTRPSKLHKGAATRGSHTATKGTKGKAPQASLAGGTYTIKKGDTLRKIAKSVYGDERLWRRIFRANRGDMANANDLKVGEVIHLPK
ncbi:MAG TPA: LysM peptidoglycan-binding domain-containing protein [Phycisphaerae bacterium]|nr:LysM peptidoglycan-binding domain-containing protein [Phycisphaerae bacterium]